MPNQPLVTVAIACFNEAVFIEQTVKSVIDQTYSNIEIIVSDNHSTDNTWELLAQFKAIPGVKLVRQKENLGISKNFKFLLDNAQGDLFMWLGGHDMLHPNFITDAVVMHQKHPKCSLVHFQHQYIDRSGNNLKTELLSDSDTRGLSKVESAKKVFSNRDQCTEFHGVFKTSFKDQIPFKNATIGFDHLIIFSFSLFGSIIPIEQQYYYRREVRKENAAEIIERYKKNLKLSFNANQPYLTLINEYINFIIETKALNFKEKVNMVFFLLSNRPFGINTWQVFKNTSLDSWFWKPLFSFLSFWAITRLLGSAIFRFFTKVGLIS